MSVPRKLTWTGVLLVAVSFSHAATQHDYNQCGEGNPDDQIQACTHVIQAANESPRNVSLGYLRRGEARREKRDYDGALADMTEAIKRKRDAYTRRGIVYSAIGEYERAASDFTEALRKEPDDSRASYQRGLAFCNLHRLERAVDDFLNAARADQDIDIGEWIYPLSCMTRNDYERAVVLLNEKSRLNAKDPVVLNLRGCLYSILDDDGRAIADFTRAIALAPRYSDALYNRGQAYARLKDYDRAITDLSRAIAASPFKVSAYTRRAEIYLEKGDAARAMADIKQGTTVAVRTTQQAREQSERFEIPARKR